jgi:hypothetical protein
MNTKLLNRRQVLRGLGGAIVAAPFLSSVAEREAKAQTSTPPKRLIVYFTHYGCLTDRWFPAKSHGELTSDDYKSNDTLSSLAPFAKKLLMVRGIRSMNEWSFQGSNGQTTDPHTQVCGSYFTCQPVTPDNGKFTATPIGRSLDHVCAEQVNPNGGAPLFIQIGGVSGTTSNTQSCISFDKANQIFPGYGTPQQIYTNLTNMFGKGPVTADTYKVARGKSVIDIVRDDLTNLKRTPMSKSDQQKLDAWAQLLHETTGAVNAQCSADTATKLGLTSSTTQGSSGLGQDISKVGPVMMNLAVLSAICDANRVIFMKTPPNYTFKFLNQTIESHGLSHRIGNANMGGPCVSGVMDMLHDIDVWYAQQFAYLVGQLDSFSEGNGTLLDNTATVWFNELSDGDSHNLNNLPILQAGSCAGYFKTGWAVNVEGAKTDLSRGHSTEECKNGSTATNLDSVGTPADQGTMPINKYFCNLMNAIGVKADKTGFPVKGGTEVVTKFGMYDDSKLFKGGGTNPASIKNPEEYKELRAGS